MIWLIFLVLCVTGIIVAIMLIIREFRNINVTPDNERNYIERSLQRGYSNQD